MSELKQSSTTTADYRRYGHELFFSLAIALSFLTALLHSSIYWSGQFFGWMVGINQSFNRRPREGFGEYLAFALWAFVLMIGLFLLLRAFSRTSLMARLLGGPAGLSVIAAPAACFWVIQHYQPVLFDGVRHLDWLVVEEAIAILGVLLYSSNRWRISVPTTILLLTVHFVFWSRAYYLTLASRGPHLLSVPISAYLSLLMWGYYLGRRNVSVG
ncbi:MAG: hypothetical protein ACLQBA_06370 [Candidatus Binataceae bacterium]